VYSHTLTLSFSEVGPASLASSSQPGPTSGAQSGAFLFLVAPFARCALVAHSSGGLQKFPGNPNYSCPSQQL
jgi:hypothetical protein